MELIVLMLLGAASGAYALMSEDTGEGGEESDQELQARRTAFEESQTLSCAEDSVHKTPPSHMDDSDRIATDYPEANYVNDQDLHDMTKLGFHRWDVNTQNLADLSLLQDGKEHSFDIKDEGIWSHPGYPDYELYQVGWGSVPDYTGPNTTKPVDGAYRMDLEFDDDNQKVWLRIPKEYAMADHAYRIRLGDGDDQFRTWQNSIGASRWGVPQAMTNGVVYGGAGDDFITENYVPEIHGDSGDDRIWADHGIAYGGEGDDEFRLHFAVAERGDWDVSSKVYGGEGNDVFIVGNFIPNTDRFLAIHDFEPGEDWLKLEVSPEQSHLSAVTINEVDTGTEVIFSHKGDPGKEIDPFDTVVWLDGTKDFNGEDIVMHFRATMVWGNKEGSYCDHNASNTFTYF